jgi:hypothetical protein
MYNDVHSGTTRGHEDICEGLVDSSKLGSKHVELKGDRGSGPGSGIREALG